MLFFGLLVYIAGCASALIAFWFSKMIGFILIALGFAVLFLQDIGFFPYYDSLTSFSSGEDYSFPAPLGIFIPTAHTLIMLGALLLCISFVKKRTNNPVESTP